MIVATDCLPIAFRPEMVRAIRAGRKTQTRRLATGLEDVVRIATHEEFLARSPHPLSRDPMPRTAFVERRSGAIVGVRCPYGRPRTHLWVREAWRTVEGEDRTKPRDLNPAHRFWYEADAPHQPGYGKLRPAMFMPRFASRMTLEVVSSRLERLRDISEADAMAEGVERVVVGEGWRRYCDDEIVGVPPCVTARDSFCALWEQINGPGSWAENPLLWVVEFKVLSPLEHARLKSCEERAYASR